jgi:hypothetical protein
MRIVVVTGALTVVTWGGKVVGGMSRYRGPLRPQPVSGRQSASAPARR